MLSSATHKTCCNKLLHSTRQYTILTTSVKTCSRMNSDIVQNLCGIVFKEIHLGSFQCKFCSCVGVNTQEMIIHIFHKHSRFWDIAIARFDWIMPQLWDTCFENGNNMYKCVHCSDEIYTADRRVLHRHMIADHRILLLSYSLLYN